MEIYYTIVPLFFLAALFHSSVGFGGGSSYLAIMAIFLVPYQTMPIIALICNIIVVTGGVYLYYKSNHIKIFDIIPFVIGSIPLSYLGGKISIDKNIFLILLACTLLVASFNLIFFNSEKRHELKKRYLKKQINRGVDEDRPFVNFIFNMSIGAFIGFISGLVGIGGGIFLSPLLYLIGWGYAKKISATASVFILVNSIAGLSGQIVKNGFHFSVELMTILPLCLAVFIGGQLGSRLGIFKLSELVLKRITAMIAFMAGIRILIHVV